MPILVRDAGSGPRVVVPATAPRLRAASWSWTSPSGATVSLTSGADGLMIPPGGIAGHMMPPQTVLESLPLGVDGGYWQGQQWQPRIVTLTFWAWRDDPEGWSGMPDWLTGLFDTSSGEGILTSTSFDGVQRMLACRYVAGLDSPDGGDHGARQAERFTIQLKAMNPWWRGPATSVTMLAAPGDPVYFLPFPPKRIAPSDVLGSPVRIVNRGRVPAFPVWTLTGPFSSVTLTSALGESFTLTHLVADQESITVDTDPAVAAGSKITDQAGANLWGVATTGFPSLWPLPAGETTVQAEFTGATANTKARLAYNPRYRTA